MVKLYIEHTHKTPEIGFDFFEGKMSIAGVSVPENAHEFYFPLIEWLQKHLPDFKKNTLILDCKISYLNTSSLQFLGDIFFLLDDMQENSPAIKVEVNWYYDSYDSDMKETGMDFKDAVNIDFNLKEVVV